MFKFVFLFFQFRNDYLYTGKTCFGRHKKIASSRCIYVSAECQLEGMYPAGEMLVVVLVTTNLESVFQWLCAYEMDVLGK